MQTEGTLLLRRSDVEGRHSLPQVPVLPGICAVPRVVLEDEVLLQRRKAPAQGRAGLDWIEGGQERRRPGMLRQRQLGAAGVRPDGERVGLGVAPRLVERREWG